jgi:hypothetical protein
VYCRKKRAAIEESLAEADRGELISRKEIMKKVRATYKLDYWRFSGHPRLSIPTSDPRIWGIWIIIKLIWVF